MDLNKAMIIGRLTRDPELRTIPSGVSVANFGIATNFVYTDHAGVKQQRVEYHDIVMWRRLAEIAGQYLRKGAKVYVEGRLQTRSWDDPNGFKHYKTEIIAENMIMLDRAPSSGIEGGGGSFSRSSGQSAQPRAASLPKEGAAINATDGSAKKEPSAATPWDRGVQQEEELPTIDIGEEVEEESVEEVKIEDIPF
jgi:single-strand DNA-binding protein